LWLDCNTEQSVANAIGIDQKTAHNWIKEFSANADFSLAPASRQHFDIWQFQTSDKSAGQQSYFGASQGCAGKDTGFLGAARKRDGRYQIAGRRHFAPTPPVPPVLSAASTSAGAELPRMARFRSFVTG
jgi:hypothetical protein